MTTPVVEGKASFALRGHNPDVLSCIANLSNDEVFTPPELANRMLDTVAEAWSEAHDGASIWEDPSVTFLDPFTKSGVFLREITRRLTDGLAEQIPDLEERVDHILTRQVYGIGITRLTALLARRSVYCSKDATGEHSVASSFDRDWGNIWFERTEHIWAGGKCAYCGASQAEYARGIDLETHAYAFIHTTDIKARLARMFGADMQFDVIIGNPPYQLDDEGGHRPVPLYHRFVGQAKALEPRFLLMVTPSRWMAGGLGLGSFRETMLADDRIRVLVDYPVASEVFPGVEIKGGVSYFLWSRDLGGLCRYSTVRNGVGSEALERNLAEHDILVRDVPGLPLLRRVLARNEVSFETIVASVRPFGDKLRSNFRDYKQRREGAYQVSLLLNEGGKRVEVWTKREYVTANLELARGWKIFLPKAGSDGGQRLPNPVIGTPRLGFPGQVSTETYLAIGPFETEVLARQVLTYLSSQFARYLISLRKVSQDNVPSTFRWLPLPGISTNGEAIRERYALTSEEIAHINQMVTERLSTDG
jgi:site-specific DNA-methyltransferase (adenine-specific)